MAERARADLARITQHENDLKNKNRLQKVFNPGDIVFVLRKGRTPGVSPTLQTKYLPSPFVVVRALSVTTLVRRIADSFTSLYSNNMIKKYSEKSALFNDLDPEVKNVLKNDFEMLNDVDIQAIVNADPLTIPREIGRAHV